MNIKKYLAALLALCMIFSMVACGGQTNAPEAAPEVEAAPAQETPAVAEKEYYNKEGLRICDEPITITVSGAQGYTNNWEENVMWDFFKEEMGIVMDCSPQPWEAISSQYALMLANNEQPDMLINMDDTVSKEQVDLDGKDGYWLDFSQYLDIMPNFVATMEANPDWAEYLKTETGAIYSIGQFKAADVGRVQGNIYVNKEVLAKAGVDYEIKSTDDLYNALVAVKNNCPELIPLAITPDTGWTINAECILRAAFGVNTTVSNYMLAFDADGNAFLNDLSDGNREYLKFMNKLYKEGLLDQECFLRTGEEYRAKEYADEFAFFSDSGFSAAEHGEPDGYEWIAALTSPVKSTTSYNMLSKVMPGVKCIVKADTEYPEAICRLIDYMFTEDGMWLGCGAGIEGVTFDWLENEYGLKLYDNSAYKDPNVEAWHLQVPNISQALQFFNAADRSPFNGLDAATLEKIAVDPNLSTNHRVYATQMLTISDIDEVFTAATPSSYTEDQTQELTTLKTDLQNYIKAMNVSFISGEKDIADDAVWNAHIEQIKAMGYDRLMQIETEAHG